MHEAETNSRKKALILKTMSEYPLDIQRQEQKRVGAIKNIERVLVEMKKYKDIICRELTQEKKQQKASVFFRVKSFFTPCAHTKKRKYEAVVALIACAEKCQKETPHKIMFADLFEHFGALYNGRLEKIYDNLLKATDQEQEQKHDLFTNLASL